MAATAGIHLRVAGEFCRWRRRRPVCSAESLDFCARATCRYDSAACLLCSRRCRRRKSGGGEFDYVGGGGDVKLPQASRNWELVRMRRRRRLDFAALIANSHLDFGWQTFQTCLQIVCRPVGAICCRSPRVVGGRFCLAGASSLRRRRRRKLFSCGFSSLAASRDGLSTGAASDTLVSSARVRLRGTARLA